MSASACASVVVDGVRAAEAFGLVTKDDNYESFVHAVALEVANRATIRENQRKEISRHVHVVV